MSQTKRALTLIIGLLFAPLTQAAVVTYGFTGLVDFVSEDLVGAIPDSIVAGQSTVVGYFTFDDAASDELPIDTTFGLFRGPDVAIYMLVDGAFDYRGSLGSLTTGGVGVYDNFSWDTNFYDGFNEGLNPVPATAISAFDANVVTTALGVDLYSTNLSLLNSDALLGLDLEAISLTEFDSARSFIINAINESNCPGELCYVADIEGTVTSLWRIPEPATLALFGLGLAGLGVMRRKKLAA